MWTGVGKRRSEGDLSISSTRRDITRLTRGPDELHSMHTLLDAAVRGGRNGGMHEMGGTCAG
jgi:hypothetical protein